MDDGYFNTNYKSIILGTENFSKVECLLLIQVLEELGIKSTLDSRNKVKDTYRIRIFKESMSLLRKLVINHMHPDFLYKLG
jgi:hypothetical protein